jgi:23S rRNA (cytosine1962-C5)-methyltransferase
MSSINLPEIRLKPTKERSVLNFHPWIFSGAVQNNTDQFKEGELVRVIDSKGNFLALGFFHHGSIKVRIISFTEEEINATFWFKRINSALDYRRSLPGLVNSNTNCYRLIHAEGDLLPGLIIDIYNNIAVIQAHEAGVFSHLHDIKNALMACDGLKLTTIYNKSAETLRKLIPGLQNEFLLGDQESVIVSENGIKFKVDVVRGQKTGFFIDQRENRKLLSEYTANRDVLNTFCYSGGFSLYSLQGDARSVISVDSSEKAIGWADENVLMNSFDESRHQSHTGDVFTYLKEHSGRHDIIILDPPAFAKHLSATEQAIIGYRNLNESALRSIRKGGLLFTFSCSQAIDKTTFRKILFMAAARSRRTVRIVHQLSQAPDHPINIYHPEGEYLKGLVLRAD